MPFCIECGGKIPQQAKFCPQCGSKNFQEQENKQDIPEPVAPPVITEYHEPDPPEHETTETVVSPQEITFTLLDPGDTFAGYVIVKPLNKDVEGIKYVAKKPGSEELLLIKIYHNYFFDRAEKLFNLQLRLNRLNKISESFVPRIVEVNQSHVPRYVVSKFIEGESLSDIKHNTPERFTETFVREIAAKLINAASIIYKNGLSINTLNLLGVMIDRDQELSVLLSGISFDADIDEREDIFTIGVILAQILSQSGFYHTMYSETRLREHKFNFIPGASIEMNKFLADCLHRNIGQRFKNFKVMDNALKALPPVSECNLYVEKEGDLELNITPSESHKPHGRFDYFFWVLIGFIVILVGLILTTNIYSYIFGGPQVEFQFTAFGPAADSLKTSTFNAPPPIERNTPISSTGYGDFRTTVQTENQFDGSGQPIDPRRNIPAVIQTRPGIVDNQRAKVIPDYMVYVESNTFGLGRLQENLHHNVSITGFYISKYEVTQGEWNKLMRAANVNNRGDDYPVENISWFDAVLYANGLSEAEGLTPCYRIRGLGSSRVVTCDFRANGYRLPTEAEWEIAAKGGKLFSYSGSEDPNDVAWFKDNSAGRTRKPGQKDANGFGLYDMSGNVAEWCWDWYDVNYTRTLTTFVNPVGPDTGTHKAIRGGSVLNGEGRNLSVVFRDKGEPSRGYPYVGFRLVRTN